MFRIIIYFIYFFFLNLSFSNVRNSISSGDWNNTNTWYPTVPSCGDTIFIKSGHVVNINNSINCTSDILLIYIDGVLNFNNGQKMTIPYGSGVYISPIGKVTADSYNGKSNVIQICDGKSCVNQWVASDGVIKDTETIFGIVPDISVVLPIQMGEINVKNTDNLNYIIWETITEINNDYFLIERSEDGYNWINIGYVYSYGNSQSKKSYELIDSDYNDVINYYRITQYDNDGESETFDIISVDNRSDIKKIVKVINLLGQEVDHDKRGEILIIIYSDGSSIKTFRE